jgi:hypothetical protein
VKSLKAVIRATMAAISLPTVFAHSSSKPITRIRKLLEKFPGGRASELNTS